MRIEEDFLGKVNVPDGAYYGSFTARANENFQLTRIKVHSELIKAVALIKKSAALANSEIGTLDQKVANAIVKAADEVIAGKLDSEFVLDAFQAGAGTPLHMNVNEVIANRAEEILGGKKGSYKMVHPNNHVNMAQSSNNVIPSAIKIAAIRLARTTTEEGKLLAKALRSKAAKYRKTLKIGRTHLQDAVPISYGQVFDAWARAIEKDIETVERGKAAIREIGVGGTATGTGITAHPKFRERVTHYIKKEGSVEVEMAKDGVEITQNMNDFLVLSAAYRNYAITLSRIANDLRLLASGPKAGMAEIILPEVEPGSSIMPGKVNPSIPESVNMLAYQVIGNDHAIMMAVQSGQLELNFATPLIAHNIFQSAELLANGSSMFRRFCIEGLEVDLEKTKENFDRSFGYATALNPYLGYKEVSLLVKEAYAKKISLRQLVLDKKLMKKEQLDAIIATATGPSEVKLRQ